MAKECQKTENVDLKKLLTAEERCAEIIKELLEVESSHVRMVCMWGCGSVGWQSMYRARVGLKTGVPITPRSMHPIPLVAGVGF